MTSVENIITVLMWCHSQVETMDSKERAHRIGAMVCIGIGLFWLWCQMRPIAGNVRQINQIERGTN
jgi:hypothetical protein